MNLLDEEINTKKPDNSKKITRIIIISMVIVLITIIGIFAALVYIQGDTLKFYIDGVSNEKVKEMMVEDTDGTIYFPIKEIASYLGYESYNGEYTEKSEEASKCYIQCEDEIANFSLNSNKIYTLLTSDNTSNYDYFYAAKPIRAINGKLYASVDAIEQAFNVSFSYDVDKKVVNMYTMPYLIEAYSKVVLDYGYDKISEYFINQKTVFSSMLIVTKNGDKVYGVIDLLGNAIIEAKYDYIEYLPNSGDFLVKSNNKIGIISAKRETKVQLLYDDLQLIDKDNGLYLAKRENKYGVIDSKGNIKLYIEYDQIGINISTFEKNDIKNKYLLDNGMIPVRKDKTWGAFDKNGKQVLAMEYDGFGYIASSNKDAMNLLMIPDYNVMVACKNKKYTLIDMTGKELCYPILDDVYMTISAGQKHYYMNYSGNVGVNVFEFLDTVMTKITQYETNSNSSGTNTTSSNMSNSEVQDNMVDNITYRDNVKDEDGSETSEFVNVE